MRETPAMNDPASPIAPAWNARRVAVRAVVVNALVHLWFLSAEMLAAGGSSLMERARIFTDEVPAPLNPWSTGFHLPAWLAAGFTLRGIDDRSSLLALVLPQLAFLVVSSAQMALVAAGLFHVWDWGRTRLRRNRTRTGG
ncbi:hypothetical protein [Pyxidicoccus trucidator]|uniref:hypothetical protein n=1 Tax=Pyxidicoccus trucidator TaxID=2709662 RepID=UPI0013DC520C|nr:hypothetical protein [Pyxidicoccus trucidator]